MYLNLIHFNYKFEWQWVQIALQEFSHNDNNCNLVRLWAVNYILYVYVCMCISMCAPVGVSVIKEQQPDARSSSNNNNRRFSQNIVINKLAYTLACMLSAFRWTLILFTWTSICLLRSLLCPQVGKGKERSLVRECYNSARWYWAYKSIMQEVELSERFRNIMSSSYDYLLYK